MSFSESVYSLEACFAKRPPIISVNWHRTVRARVKQYEEKLKLYSTLFTNVTEDDLIRLSETGVWHKPRPGLLPAIFDGYRNNYDVIAPLLEQHGFTGWFFIVTGFVCTAQAEQAAFAAEHELIVDRNEYADGRHALSWKEVNQISKTHVICSHTRSHSDLSIASTEAIEDEILGSQDDFISNIGRRVQTISLFSGHPYGYNHQLDRQIKAAGYGFVFSNLRMQRIAPNPIHNNSNEP